MLEQIQRGNCIDVLKTLPNDMVDCCITSPPYFGLRSYLPDGHPDKALEIGLDATPEAYVARLVEVFREVRRVLKDEGTLWLNLGDSYANDTKWGGSTGGKHVEKLHGNTSIGRGKKHTGLKSKDLIGIPWKVAFALRDDGWYLRSDIIWEKPNCMPESVRDRPTRCHEHLFLLSKRQKYYYDSEAIKEDALSDHKSGNGFKRPARVSYQNPDGSARGNDNQWDEVGGKRNARTVWTIPTKPFKEAHFAVMPEALVEPCILAGTSEKGYCPGCGKPWERQRARNDIDQRANEVIKTDCIPGIKAGTSADRVRKLSGSTYKHVYGETIGWLPTCSCSLDPVPGIVLDPFFGAGTVGAVAKRLGRSFIGIELNPAYNEISKARIAKIPLKLDRWTA